MMQAARCNRDSEWIMTIIECGADINQRNSEGLTALMMAARSNRNPRATKALLAAGADARLRDSSGMTALAYGLQNKSFIGKDVIAELEAATSN